VCVCVCVSVPVRLSVSVFVWACRLLRFLVFKLFETFKALFAYGVVLGTAMSEGVLLSTFPSPLPLPSAGAAEYFR